MKKIGFLSFGHWSPTPGSGTRTARDALAAVDRPRGGGGGARRRRRLRPGPPLRPPARLALPAARRHRRAHPPHRDRHGGHRHALREPLLHGRGRRRRRPHRRRSAAARHQPRLARAGDRRLAPLRLRAGRGRDRRRHGPPPRRALPRAARGPRLRRAEPAADVPEPARPAPARAAFRGAARPHLVGRRDRRHRGLGGGEGDEPAELDPEVRRDRRALPHPAGQADPRLPRRLEGRRPRPRAPGLGQPQHLRPRERPGPRLLRPLRRERGHHRLSRREHPRGLRPLLRRRAGQARRGPGRRTRRSPRPTPCCSPFRTSSGSTTTPT